MVRHRILIPAFVGSIPTSPAIPKKEHLRCRKCSFSLDSGTEEEKVGAVTVREDWPYNSIKICNGNNN